jgi:hypothetical protein
VTYKGFLWLVALVCGTAALTASPVTSQTQEEVVSLFLAEFEIPKAVYDSIQSDSIRILSEVLTAEKTVVPVSYLTDGQKRCRAAAVLVFFRAMQIVASRDQRGNVEIDVTCNRSRSTIEVQYGEHVRLVERRIGSETIIFTRTLRGNELDPSA